MTDPIAVNVFSRVTGSVPQKVTGSETVPLKNDGPATVIVGPVAKCPIAAESVTSSRKFSTVPPLAFRAVKVTVIGVLTYFVPLGTSMVKRSTGS
jgi:hypothetical protein